MEFAFTNNHTVVAAYITPFQARGTPVTEDDTVTVKSTSPTSQAKYGERSYPIENHFLPDIATAETYTAYIRDKYKEEPDTYKTVVIYLKNRQSPFLLKKCQVRIATNFVYFYEVDRKEELAVPIENIEYYQCRVHSSNEEVKNSDG